MGLMKYVITKDGPIIFPMAIQHDTFRSLAPTSAGVVMVNGEHITAYGDSLSLGLKSVPGQDSKMIRGLLI